MIKPKEEKPGNMTHVVIVGAVSPECNVPERWLGILKFVSLCSTRTTINNSSRCSTKWLPQFSLQVM